MPPKRRKAPAPARAVTPSSEPPAITTPRGKTIEDTAASTRSKRGVAASSAAEQSSSKKAKTTTTTKAQATAADAPTALAPKKRGRPARAKADEVIEEAAEELMQPETVEPQKVEPKKRGRPGKATAQNTATALENAAEEEEKTVADAPVAKRGRHGKVPVEDTAVEEPQPGARRGRSTRNVTTTTEPEPVETPASKKRGRQPKAAVTVRNTEEVEPVPTPATTRTTRSNKAAAPEPEPASEESKTKKRGKGKAAATAEPVEDIDQSATEDLPPPKARGRGRGKAATETENEVEFEPEPQSGTARKTRGGNKNAKAVPEPEPTAEEAPVATGKRGRAKGKAAAQPDLELEAGPPVELAPTPKKRGRPKGKGHAEPEPQPDEDAKPPVATEAATPKKRGRPAKKAKTEEPVEEREDEPAPATDKRNKRKGKVTVEPDTDVDTQPAALRRGRGAKNAAAATPKVEVKITPKKRGRPARKVEDDTVVTDGEDAPAPKRQARGKKATKDTEAETDAQRDTEMTEDVDDALLAVPTAGRKRKATAAASKGKKTKLTAVAEEDGVDDSGPTNPTEATTEVPDELDTDAHRDYWLMKAEPESRLEQTANGTQVDVKFTIDDLRSKAEPEPWEGIRNNQAQKNMREMKVGDYAFFYESNTKVPGIVGIMQIVQEVSTDPTAFDKSSPYYDAKSNPKNPKWQLVHVKFVRKFPNKVALKDLQQYGKSGEALANMELLKQSRLSVCKVSPAEWKFVLNELVEEDGETGDAGASGGAAIDDFAAAFNPPDSIDEAQTVALETGDVSHLSGLASKIPQHNAEAPHEDVGAKGAAQDEGSSSGLAGLMDSIVGDAAPIPSTEVAAPSGIVGRPSGILASIESAAESILGSAVRAVSRGASKAPAVDAAPDSIIVPTEPPVLLQDANKVRSRAGSAAPSARASSRPASRGSARAGSRAPSVRASSRAGSVRASTRAGSARPSSRGTDRPGSSGSMVPSSFPNPLAAMAEEVVDTIDNIARVVGDGA